MEMFAHFSFYSANIAYVEFFFLRFLARYINMKEFKCNHNREPTQMLTGRHVLVKHVSYKENHPVF